MAGLVTRFSGGHNTSVLSIEVENDTNGKIISGGESGELAVWSPEGVNLWKKTISDDDISSIVCSARNAKQFFVGSGENIYLFDQRQLDKPVDAVHVCGGDINQIALNDNEKYLATADDLGIVTIINLEDMKIFKTLKKHLNICSTVSFVPNKPFDVFSGAYDCTLVQWDFFKSRAKCSANMKDLEDRFSETDTFVVGLPFVHSLAVSASGKLLACGTENALVHLFDATKRNFSFVRTLYSHSQGVSRVLIPDMDDRFVVSCANDNRICLWDLESSDHSDRLTSSNSVGKKRDNSSGRNKAVSDQKLKPRLTIKHSEKINWSALGENGGGKFIVVADNTTCPACYTLPI